MDLQQTQRQVDGGSPLDALGLQCASVLHLHPLVDEALESNRDPCTRIGHSTSLERIHGIPESPQRRAEETEEILDRGIENRGRNGACAFVCIMYHIHSSTWCVKDLALLSNRGPYMRIGGHLL